MSAPNTDIDTQEQRHKPALLGMGAAVGCVAILLALSVGWTVYQGGTPQGTEVQIDSRTGAAVSAETGDVVN